MDIAARLALSKRTHGLYSAAAARRNKDSKNRRCLHNGWKGGKLEILAMNKLDDKTDASMALAGKELFIRGKQNLYCIAEK